MNKENPFSRVLVETKDGSIIDITDLPKEEYEAFLELTHQVRIRYIALPDVIKRGIE